MFAETIPTMVFKQAGTNDIIWAASPHLRRFHGGFSLCVSESKALLTGKLGGYFPLSRGISSGQNKCHNWIYLLVIYYIA